MEVLLWKKIYEFLRENIFKIYIENGLCKELAYNKNNIVNLKCKDEAFTMFPTLYLNVNNGNEKIPFEVAERIDDKGYVNIICNYLYDKKDYFLIERTFFYQYNVLFDYEDESVTIYE